MKIFFSISLIAVLGQALGQVMTGGIPLHVGAERDDDLVGRAVGQTLLEWCHPQFIRTDAVHRGNLAAEHVVAAPERAGFLDVQKVNGPLDDAEGSLVARRVGTNAARRFLGQAAAVSALAGGNGHAVRRAPCAQPAACCAAQLLVPRADGGGPPLTNRLRYLT